MINEEKIIVMDFGGQYNQLIARRVRENNIYCEIVSYDTPIEKLKEMKPTGIIFTGGPDVVYQKDAPICDKQVLELGIPVLGICYGAQLIAYLKDGLVEKASTREYGRTEIEYNTRNTENQGNNNICSSIPSRSFTYRTRNKDFIKLPFQCM